jgi:Cytochrome P460
MFANDVALASARDGAPLASGAVVVMEVYKARLDAEQNPVVGSDGFFEPDALAGIAVMETRSGWGEDCPDAWRNGEWEFAAFKPDDQTRVERDYQAVLRMPQAAARERLPVLVRRPAPGRRELILRLGCAAGQASARPPRMLDGVAFDCHRIGPGPERVPCTGLSRAARSTRLPRAPSGRSAPRSWTRRPSST